MVIIMASEVKEIITKLNEIGTDVAVIKNDINHIKGKLECLEKENKKQNEEVEKIKERVNSLNLEIVKIASIVSIVALALGSVITGLVSKLIEMAGFK
jgi:predicted nuclease with TOPRIM domain